MPPVASAEARIASFDQKPESGGMPIRASVPIRNIHEVVGMILCRPPIFRMSCSPASRG